MFKIISDKSVIFRKKYERKFRSIWAKNHNDNKSRKRDLSDNMLTLNKDRWLVNLTTVSIPPNVKKVLEVGPKFVIPHSSNNLNYETIADCDHIVRNITSDKEVKEIN